MTTPTVIYTISRPQDPVVGSRDCAAVCSLTRWTVRDCRQSAGIREARPRIYCYECVGGRGRFVGITDRESQPYCRRYAWHSSRPAVLALVGWPRLGLVSAKTTGGLFPFRPPPPSNGTPRVRPAAHNSSSSDARGRERRCASSR